jgi:hypothetical protein
MIGTGQTLYTAFYHRMGITEYTQWEKLSLDTQYRWVLLAEDALKGFPVRINVHPQEIDLDTVPEIVIQHGEGINGPEDFVGVRFYLALPPNIQTTELDDGRSAVTFWLPRSSDDRRKMANGFNEAYQLIVEVIEPAGVFRPER